MNIIPFKKLIFYSELSERELIFKLSEHVKKTYILYDNYQDSSASYFGIIKTDNFFIYRKSKNQNSFLPHIYGKIKEEATRSKIVVTMQLAPWITILLSLILCVLIYALIKSHLAGNIVLFTIAVYFMPLYFFNEESRKAENDLTNILGPLNKVK